MSTDKSPAQKLLNNLIQVAVTPTLKPLGFRKSELNWHRRHKDVVQVINLQVCHGSTWEEKQFYINVGLAFDAICQLTNTSILEKPKEYNCDDRGTRDRLENLIPQAPTSWVVNINSNPQVVTQQLKNTFKLLVGDLQKIDGIQAYQAHAWFNRLRPKQENAQTFYLLGDFDAAWQELQDLCALFADRQAINQPEWWIDRLGLPRLRERLEA
jgi:hypothetical protein